VARNKCKEKATNWSCTYLYFCLSICTLCHVYVSSSRIYCCICVCRLCSDIMYSSVSTYII